MSQSLIGVQRYHCEGDRGAQSLHCHEEVEFVHVHRGRGVFQYGRSRYATGPGLLSVVCPQELHAGTPRSDEFAVQVLNVSSSWFEAAGLDWRLLWRKEAVCESPATLPSFLQAYEALRQNQSLLRQEETLLTLYQVTSRQQYEEQAPEQGRVKRVAMLLRERFADDLSLTELASAVGLTPTYLCRAFKQTVGLPPHAYQISLRVARAKRLLEQGEAAGEVAREVGFYDQSHLTFHFKRLLGVTPKSVGEKAISSYISRPAKR